MLTISAETKMCARQCFSTASGKKMLTHILMECGYFDDDLKSEGDIARRNIGTWLLHCLGVFDKVNLPQQQRFVNKLFDIPVDMQDKGKRGTE